MEQIVLGDFHQGGGEICEMVMSLLVGTDEDMGEGGVKKSGKSGDVLYGRPLLLFFPVINHCFRSG